MGEKNPDTVRNVVIFDKTGVITDVKEIKYEYKTDIDVLRVTNMADFKFKLNGTSVDLPLLVNPGDVLKIEINKQTIGVKSTITLQEKLVR